MLFIVPLFNNSISTRVVEHGNRPYCPTCPCAPRYLTQANPICPRLDHISYTELKVPCSASSIKSWPLFQYSNWSNYQQHKMFTTIGFYILPFEIHDKSYQKSICWHGYLCMFRVFRGGCMWGGWKLMQKKCVFWRDCAPMFGIIFQIPTYLTSQNVTINIRSIFCPGHTAIMMCGFQWHQEANPSSCTYTL